MTKLSHKIWIGVLGSLAVASVLTIWMVLRGEHDIIKEEMDHSGKTLARTISSFCPDLLLAYEYPGLTDYIRRSAEESPHVAFIRIWGTDEDTGKKRVIAQVPTDLTATLENGEYESFRSPIVVEVEDVPPEKLGEVEVALTTARMARQLEASTWRLLFGAAVSFALLAGVISIVLRRSVLNPLAVLDQQAQRIGSGDLESPIRPTTRDELGRLAGTMDTMRTNLRDSLERIEQQVEELRENDRMKDEFLANTSHELKTPLHGILGLSDNIQNGSYGEVSDDVKAPLEKISACATRLWRMTEEILTFSKLVKTEGCERVPRERFLLAEQLQDALLDLEVSAARKGLELEVAIDPDMEVDCARSTLEDLLRVFADNAVKYTDTGRVEIIARRWSDDSPVAGFQVAVRDTGVGISDENLSKIFEPFVQGFDHETRSHDGVGLGLAIARKLTDRLRGKLIAESVEGEGSCFTILVPEVDDTDNLDSLFVPWTRTESTKAATPRPKTNVSAAVEPDAPVEEDETSFKKSPAAAPVPRRAGSKRFHILITDDEPINREVLVGALHREFDVTQAQDGESCLEALRRKKIDLLILDIMMPGLSGYDVLKAMKKENLLEKTPVIVLSAKTSSKAVVKGIELGASDYLGKPFHREELLCRIRTHLKILQQRDMLHKEVREKSQALRTAERANYIKAQFLANMSHEIRTPINGILGFASLGIEDEEMETEERLEFFRNIQECTDSLLKVVDDILDLTRIESNQLKFEIEECRADLILQKLRPTWESQATEKGLEFCVEIDASFEQPIWSNAERLGQIFTHIVGNSVKFTRKGSVKISARQVQDDAYESTFVELAVTDTGVGIDAEKIDDIFIPFMQADISMSREFGGTGLGLSIARQVARILGGDITVVSEIGKGSTFTIRVPTDSRACCASISETATEATTDDLAVPSIA